MTLYELWRVAPTSFVFIRQKNGELKEYVGGKANRDEEVLRVKGTAYPMYKNVLEVTLAKDGDGEWY